MNAEPATQLRLLDLQSADTSLAQLEHRRRTLPEAVATAQAETAARLVHDEVVDARTAVDDIALEQRRLETDVDTVRARTTRDQQRLADGGLPPRELESIEHEIATLHRRQSTLEDELLEVMERAETAGATLQDASTRETDADADAERWRQQRDAALVDIADAVALHTPQRAQIAAEVPADLLALYERARAQTGTGAALLRQRRCEACHIELSGTEVSALRTAAPDAVVRCENCRAVLVRTAESGL